MNGEPGRREGGLKQGDRIVSLHPDSLAARLCRLYEAAGPPEGPPCRSPCLHSCFLVSETEFVLILDDLLRRLPAESCREIARRAKEFKRTLETEESEAAEKINGVVSLRDIFMLGRTLLPFECVLYKDGICRTPGVRPLACRGLDIPPEFLFLKTGEGVLFRRPLPLFYWFSLVFSDEELFGRLRDTPFYRDLLSLREAEYIERLAAYGTGCHDNT